MGRERALLRDLVETLKVSSLKQFDHVKEANVELQLFFSHTTWALLAKRVHRLGNTHCRHAQSKPLAGLSTIICGNTTWNEALSQKNDEQRSSLPVECSANPKRNIPKRTHRKRIRKKGKNTIKLATDTLLLG